MPFLLRRRDLWLFLCSLKKFIISLMDCLLVILLESGFHFVLNQNFFLNSWLGKFTGVFVLAQTLSQVQLESFSNLSVNLLWIAEAHYRPTMLTPAIKYNS